MHPAWQRLLELAEPYRQAFESGCADPRQAQERFLAAALAANRDTDIGRRLGFATITTPAAYADRVPVAGHADLEAGLADWQQGNPSLCAEPVVLTQWTSGSTRPAKAVPYSAAGLEGFRHAVLPWLAALCRDEPALAAGHVYWALSPAGTDAAGGRAAASDAAYLGEAAAPLEQLSAVPLALAGLTDVDLWRHYTALFLAACEDLGLVSIWSPSFLHPLLDALEQDGERIVDTLLRPERHAAPPDLTAPLRALAGNARRHAERLRAATAGGVLDTALLWPRLRRLSCWTHGNAARQLPALARRLPGVRIEPKGLLATEAAASVPMFAAPDPVAAVNSAFLELRVDAGGCRALCAWRPGDEGRLVVTTRSGLWRYDTGDRVRITGFWRRAPCMVFLGRDGQSVDLCGEKLDEVLVRERLPSDVDALQAPDPGGRGYCLFLDAGQIGRARAEQLAERMDAALCEILHYRHARSLGQLAALRAVRVWRLTAHIAERARERRGAPLATVKVPLLDDDDGWLTYFAQVNALVREAP